MRRLLADDEKPSLLLPPTSMQSTDDGDQGKLEEYKSTLTLTPTLTPTLTLSLTLTSTPTLAPSSFGRAILLRHFF